MSKYKMLICTMLLLSITGCSKITNVEATIIRVAENSDNCMGRPYTTVKTEKGVASFCAYAGEVGDTFQGYWRSEHFDASHNGFRLAR